ncbi:cytochrome c-type biogenesis protein CcmH [Pseudoduganella sp. LjRoot289]|uniref:cytochrome c-type biogenesis protein n=1 Tax=Pseudoduganella sp. LjRoot289 TaxID=3342314 RepID=UPI003ED08272
MARRRAALPSLLLAASAWALPAPGPEAPGSVLDQRVTHLAGQLRCLVCQNQTIADSHAQLALDLKAQLRTQLAQGRTDEQVITFMTERYGDFVLYRPPVKTVTWLLWFGPFALLAAGLLILLRALRRQAALPHLTEEENS